MNPEAQRIAIAEAYGWRWLPRLKQRQGFRDMQSRDKARHCRVWDNGTFGGTVIPNYLYDLNAMHEAEKVLDAVTQRGDYWDYLFSITGGEFEMCHATAAQRAEAFLRTIGKWEDAK